MESTRQTTKNYVERKLYDLNEALRGANALVPWFDLPLFLKELVRVLCICIVVRNSFVMSAFIVLYLTLTDHNEVLSCEKSHSKSKITLAMVYEFCVSFAIYYSLVLVIYLIPFPSLVLLTFVRTALDSFLDSPKFLKEKLLLEEMDEERLRDTLQRLGTHVPLWMSTPDHQRVEWLNKILKQLWPHFGSYIEDLTADLIEDLRPVFSLTIEKLLVGNDAPRISSVKVSERDDEVILDVSLTYCGDFEGCVEWVKGVKFEVDHLKVEAELQIKLKNFVGHLPFVGEVVVHMEKLPTINLRLGRMAKALEASKLAKKAFLDKIQSSIKRSFPLRYVLVPEVVENLIEDVNAQKSEKEKSSSVKRKRNSMWEAIDLDAIHNEVMSNQIISYLQEHQTAQKRFSDPAIGGKYTLEVKDANLVQSKDSEAASRSEKTTEAAEQSSSYVSISHPMKQANASLLYSFSQSQNMEKELYVSTLSSGSSKSVTSSLSGSSIAKDESFVSQSLPRLSESRQPEKVVQEDKDRSTISTPVKYSDSPDGDLGHSLISLGERTKTDYSPSGKMEELKATIARDVESSQMTLIDKAPSGNTTDNESIQSEETAEPFTLVSQGGLVGILDANQGHGCVELTTTCQDPNKLVVIVHRATNLPKKGGRTPNPYVKLLLQNQEQKPLMDKSTNILENTHDPSFEQSFEFELSQPLSEYTLKVSVKTKHKLPHHLGQVVLCFASYRSSQIVKTRNWYDLADPKKDHVMCWVGYHEPPNYTERSYLQNDVTRDRLV